MTRWFRMYSDVLDDPKVQRLPPDLFKAWVNLLCLASRNDGVLPCVEDIAFALRMSQDVTRDIVVTLQKCGLLDDEDGLSPHNWRDRQFRSDTTADARERKRKQRAREKQQENSQNVTECHSDSHGDVTPPDTEQNRTEQSRAEEIAHAKDPEHWKEVQDLLADRSDDLTDWETDFLHSVKWKPALTTAQAETYKGIRSKLASTSNGGGVLPSVKRGSPAYDAWIAHYAKRGPTAFYEKQDSLTVPSEFPPAEKAA